MNRQQQIERIRAKQAEADAKRAKSAWFWDTFESAGDWAFDHPISSFFIAALLWTLLMIFLLSVVGLGVYFVITAFI